MESKLCFGGVFCRNCHCHCNNNIKRIRQTFNSPPAKLLLSPPNKKKHHNYTTTPPTKQQKTKQDPFVLLAGFQYISHYPHTTHHHRPLKKKTKKKGGEEVFHFHLSTQFLLFLLTVNKQQPFDKQTNKQTILLQSNTNDTPTLHSPLTSLSKQRKKRTKEQWPPLFLIT